MVGATVRLLVNREIQFVTNATILWLFTVGCPGIFLAQTSLPAKDNSAEERALLASAQKEPGNVQIMGSLGEYYLRKEEWRRSVRWLNKALMLSPGSESIGYDLAFAREQTGDLEGAKSQIDRMLEQNDSVKLHTLLASVEDRSGNFLDAAKEYHRAAEIDPSESNIFDLATFLLLHKKFVGFVDESIKFFRYGVAQFPRSSQMMVGLGVGLYASEQYDEAVRVLCAAVDLDPTDRRPVEFLGKARKVSPELAEEVDRRLEDFAERYPENAATNYYFAFSLWERGGGEEGKNLDRIEALLKTSEARASGWYQPHYQLGVLYESEKRYPEAIREMQKTVKIEPEFAPAHFRLAVLYSKTGDKLRAVQESAIVRGIKNKDRNEDTGEDEVKK
jgi:tetratricopeptide (TPR) repeat protein